MRVGMRSGVIHDATRLDWDGDSPRPIGWTAWYPASPEAAETPLLTGGKGEPWFDIGACARDAPLLASAPPFRVAVLSHGTGGTGVSLGWLGRRLAEQGFVVLAPNHHGNHAGEPYRAEGFVCWWERAADVSVLVDTLSASGDFAGRLDLDRMLAAGFSLGGHTALALLGAVTDMAVYGAWAAGGVFARGPSNFPDLADRLPKLIETSASFRASWERQGNSYRDARVANALLLAPAPPVRGLTEASLAAITAPVHIMTGGADEEAPVGIGGDWLVERLPHASLDIVAPAGGHFIFLPEATEAGLRLAPERCLDPPAVDRRNIHDAVAMTAARMLAASG